MKIKQIIVELDDPNNVLNTTVTAPGTSNAPAAAPAGGTTPAGVAAAAPTAPAASAGQIADWKTLRDKFEAFQDADGAMVPQVRGVLRDILLQAFAVVENKKHKWYTFKQLLEADQRREKKLLEAKKK
jgi:hypothetical protein